MIISYRTPYPRAYFSWRPWGYKLYVVKSAWRLGDTVNVVYRSFKTRPSIFSFRDTIIQEELFVNKTASRRKNQLQWDRILKRINKT